MQRRVERWVVAAGLVLATATGGTVTAAPATDVARQRVVVQYDASTLLDKFSQQVFGRMYVYTDTGGRGVAVNSAGLPRDYEVIVQQQYRAAGTVAWGSLTDGFEIVLAAVGQRPSNDAGADIAAAGVGAVALTGFGRPTTEAEALALVASAAPGLTGLGWTLVEASSDAWVFHAAGPKSFSTARGTVTATVKASATVWVNRQGETSVAVLAGSGDTADAVF